MEIATIIIKDLKDCTLDERIQLKETEVNSYKTIIERRDKQIENYNKLGHVSEFLIQSTNKIRRDLAIAEAELRQLRLGIVLN